MVTRVLARSLHSVLQLLIFYHVACRLMTLRGAQATPSRKFSGMTSNVIANTVCYVYSTLVSEWLTVSR
jgi:hypothetical protein